MFRCKRAKQVHVTADMRAQLNALETRLLAVHEKALELIIESNCEIPQTIKVPDDCCKLISKIKSLDAANVTPDIVNDLVRRVVQLETVVDCQPAGIKSVHSVSMASRLCGLFACRSSKIQPARPGASDHSKLKL